VSWKDQARRRKAAEKRGRRGNRRAAAMLLRQGVLHPVDVSGAAPVFGSDFGECLDGGGDGSGE
jgi:hypothetical protein